MHHHTNASALLFQIELYTQCMFFHFIAMRANLFHFHTVTVVTLYSTCCSQMWKKDHWMPISELGTLLLVLKLFPGVGRELASLASSQKAYLQTGHLPWLFTHGTKQALWNMWLQGVTRSFSLDTNSSRQIEHSLPSSLSSSSSWLWLESFCRLNKPVLYAFLLGYVGLNIWFRILLIAFLKSALATPWSTPCGEEGPICLCWAPVRGIELNICWSLWCTSFSLRMIILNGDKGWAGLLARFSLLNFMAIFRLSMSKLMFLC